MYEVFLYEGANLPQSITKTENLTDCYDHLKGKVGCPDIVYQYDDSMLLRRGGVSWKIIKTGVIKNLPNGVSYNGDDWKEFIRQHWLSSTRIEIKRPDVRVEQLLRFMETFQPRSNQWCIVHCYDTPEVWFKRLQAKKFYQEGVWACEGSERDRYLNIVYDLKHGRRVATDEELS